MSIPNAIERVLVSTLNEDSDVNAYINGATFVSYAPSGTKTPHIILQRRSGDKKVAMSDNFRPAILDLERYNIKVVTSQRDGGFNQGDIIFALVKNSLAGVQKEIQASDGKHYWIGISEIEDDIRFASLDDEIVYCHVGGVFLIDATPDPAES